MKKTTFREKVLDYEQLRAAAHAVVDALDRVKLRRFLGSRKRLKEIDAKKEQPDSQGNSKMTAVCGKENT